MEIHDIDISEIKPYKKNARKHSKEQIEAICASIREFGWQQPIVISNDREIVIGHARFEAAKRLKVKTVPCVIADTLTDEEIKKLRLADNRLGDMSEFDLDILADDLQGLNFDDLGIDFDFANNESSEAEDEDEDGDKIPYKLTKSWENCEKGIFPGEGFYDIPYIKGVSEIDPDEVTDWIGFNYMLGEKEPENKAVHFFVDDYQFLRLWNSPDTYIDKLSRFKYVFSPDFSTYTDFPRAVNIYNCYRKHWLAAYWESFGIQVIPTISWSDSKSFRYCFAGEPKGGCIAISTVGTQNNQTAKELFETGYREAIRHLRPRQIIVSGKMPEDLKAGNIDYIEIKAFQEKWNNHD